LIIKDLGGFDEKVQKPVLELGSGIYTIECTL
jgi:hypothetical protein